MSTYPGNSAIAPACSTLDGRPAQSGQRSTWLCWAARPRYWVLLLVGLVDHFYFDIEFPHMAALFWLTVA